MLVPCKSHLHRGTRPRTASAPVRPARLTRSSNRRLPPPRGVQFSEQFMNILQESLEREEQRIAEKVGIPNLIINENLDSQDAGEEDNCGGIMWPAGIRLSRHLVQNRQGELKGARVLEIGSGTGIVGLAAACLGAHVMLTDKREQLPVMWDNVQVNAELVDAAGGSATVVELDWDEPDADPDVLDQDYDWIFGADVTYDVTRMPALAKLLRQMVLTNPTAVVKLAHMHRSKDIDKTMREIFAEEGLLVRPVDVRSTAVKDYDDPLRVDESIVFYRVSVDDNRRFLSNGAADGSEEDSEYSSSGSEEGYSSEEQQQEQAAYSSSSGSSDWQAVQDDQGRTYYYNAVTGVTQWEVPDELA